MRRHDSANELGHTGSCIPSVLALSTVLAISAAPVALADEGGISYWLPGQFGSLASVPGAPGITLPVFYYHLSSDAGASKDFPIGGRVFAGVDARSDLLFAAPSYAFSSPLLGGQAALSLGEGYGRVNVSADLSLTGPRGNVISANPEDSLTSWSDLYPQAALKWKAGDNNYMAYVAGGIPVGAYDKNRLANLGTNHYSIDAGGGYTYLDETTGRELSAVLGFTYNFENPDTHYRNGVDSHLDWALSQFLSPKLHVGLVGYLYYQLTGDSGSGAVLGDFKSQVAAVGPEVGFFTHRKVYINLKGYYEFDAKNRPEGWNTWVTVVIPL